MILANLVIGKDVIPEFLQENCTPENLARALRPLLSDTPERRQQADAFGKLDAIMSTGHQPPSVRAADIVLATMRKGSAPNLDASRGTLVTVENDGPCVCRQVRSWQ